MNHPSIDSIRKSIRNVADFPIPGIQFKDITTAIKQPHLFKMIADEISGQFMDKNITKIVAIESRGFIMGGAMAYHLNAGFVPARKPGKLPADVLKVTYDLEYGTDSLEIHRDALSPDDVVLLHDDLLATGGTALAALNLIRQFGVKQVYTSFIIELDFLEGRKKLLPFCDVYSLIHFE